MNLKPLANRVLVEVEEEQKTTKSGIVIPETVEKGDLLKGKVVAIFSVSSTTVPTANNIAL